jgi:type III secretion protein V
LAAWRGLSARAGGHRDQAGAPGLSGDPGAGEGPAPEEGDGAHGGLVLELASDLMALAHADGGRFLRETLPAVRRQLRAELGVPLPPLAVRGAPLPPGGWALLLHELPAARGYARADERLSLAPLEDLDLAGIPHRPALEPCSGRPAGLVAAADESRAAALGPVLGPLPRVAAACAWELTRNANLLLGVQETQVLLDALEPSAPALVREAARQLPPALLAEVLRRLLEEGVSIRALRNILEALLEAGGAPRGAAALTSAARRALRRQLGQRQDHGGPLHALLLDPGAERAVRESLLGEQPALAPEHAAALLDALDAALRVAGEAPVLLASSDVRRAVRLLVAPRWPRLQVLSYDELPPEQPVRPVGRLELVA